jgi:flagellar biogenesis protein FliO
MKNDVQNGRRLQNGASRTRLGGITEWLLGRLKGAGRARARLQLLERIALAPRQSLALVEAEGRRFLVASSGDGTPVFYPLDRRVPERGHSAERSQPAPALPGRRISW